MFFKAIYMCVCVCVCVFIMVLVCFIDLLGQNKLKIEFLGKTIFSPNFPVTIMV